MRHSFNYAGETVVERFKIGATVITGQIVIWDINGPGDIQDASTTGAADAFGMTLGGGTYAATAEVLVEVVDNPFAVFEAVASGGAGNVALATTDPANILVNETADTARLTVTEDLVGTISFANGILISLSGANKGQSRVITAHTNNTSTAVTVEFDSDIAVNDRFIRLPWAPGVQQVQLTTTLDQANAIIVNATGIPAQVVRVTAELSDEANPTAAVFFTLRDHFLNPLS